MQYSKVPSKDIAQVTWGVFLSQSLPYYILSQGLPFDLKA